VIDGAAHTNVPITVVLGAAEAVGDGAAETEALADVGLGMGVGAGVTEHVVAPPSENS